MILYYKVNLINFIGDALILVFPRTIYWMILFYERPQRKRRNVSQEPGGQVGRSSALSLADLEVGQTARIQAIAPESSEVLRYLADKKLLPGNLATVSEAEPLQGPLTLLVAREGASDEVILGLNLASLVLVDLK